MSITLHLTEPILIVIGIGCGLLALASLAVSTCAAGDQPYRLRRSVLAGCTTVAGVLGLALAPPGSHLELAGQIEPWTLTVLQTGTLAAATCGAMLLCVTALSWLRRHVFEPRWYTRRQQAHLTGRGVHVRDHRDRPASNTG